MCVCAGVSVGVGERERDGERGDREIRRATSREREIVKVIEE